MLAAEERVITRLKEYIEKTQRKMIDESYIITRDIQDLYCHAWGIYAATLVEKWLGDEKERTKLDEDKEHIYFVEIIPYQTITEIRLVEKWKRDEM